MKSTNDEQRQRVSHPSFVHSNASSSLNSSELTVAMIVPLLTPHPHFFLSVQPLLPRSLLELLREELALLEEVVRGSVVDEDLGGEGDVREEQGSVVGGSFGAGGGKVAGEAVEPDEGRGRDGQEREGQEGEGGNGDREGDDERFGSPRTGGWVPVFRTSTIEDRGEQSASSSSRWSARSRKSRKRDDERDRSKRRATLVRSRLGLQVDRQRSVSSHGVTCEGDSRVVLPKTMRHGEGSASVRNERRPERGSTTTHDVDLLLLLQNPRQLLDDQLVHPIVFLVLFRGGVEVEPGAYKTQKRK